MSFEVNSVTTKYLNVSGNNVNYTLPTTTGEVGQYPVLVTSNGDMMWTRNGKYSQVEHVSVTDTTEPTSLTNNGTATAVGNLLIPAHYVKVGDLLEIVISGELSTQNSNQELVIDVLSNDISIHSTGMIKLPSITDQYPFRWSMTMQVQAIGVNGELFCNSLLSYNKNTTIDSGKSWTANTFTVLDSTINHTLDCKATWSQAQPGNVFTCYSIMMTKLF